MQIARYSAPAAPALAAQSLVMAARVRAARLPWPGAFRLAVGGAIYATALFEGVSALYHALG